MADPSSLAARPALAVLASIGPTPAGVTAHECVYAGVAMIAARKGRDAQLAERFETEFGLTPPAGPNRRSSSEITLLGIGPARWLALSHKSLEDFAETLARALSGVASVIDQTDGLAFLRVKGQRARETFAKGLPIDLDAAVFLIDHVAVSAIAHIGVTIWRLDDETTFELAVPRSYAGDFANWLQESAAVFGFAVDAHIHRESSISR